MGPVSTIISPITNAFDLIRDSDQTDVSNKPILLLFKPNSNEDFRIMDRPFSYSNKPDYPEELKTYSDLIKYLGWGPRSIHRLSAGCNSALDHKILGELTLTLCKLSKGIIALGTPLSRLTNEEIILENPNILNFPQDTFFRPQEFELWLRNPNFRMLK
ncbi:DUF6368 family protein [Leptospira stimsonii]|uniref:Uncharacterized protein n=1 Tax=Leptospira stimsonii TaxID=2202203 RepID=A0ABY2MZT0_9LEPT|nr:DUF6368 family protein [Leptospira stimsonii]TGK17783.1 hypothetical protein EHO98_13690 [Leptospira stimsonii]TGM12625.1 hypothetical protein EHQ90_15130 [Leptospira stimsonii]